MKDNLELYYTKIRLMKNTFEKFQSREECIAHLVKETRLPEDECNEAYEFIMNIDLPK